MNEISRRDSLGLLAGSAHDPANGGWRAWRLSGPGPRACAVHVDQRDIVRVSDFGASSMPSFDPATERFESFVFRRAGAAIRQILGRPGEVWLPESGAEHILVIRTD